VKGKTLSPDPLQKMDAIDRLLQALDKGITLKQQLKDKLIEHKQCIDKHGRDMPEIRNWKWSDEGKAERAAAGRKDAWAGTKWTVDKLQQTWKTSQPKKTKGVQNAHSTQ
jgi:hypothetical protein